MAGNAGMYEVNLDHRKLKTPLGNVLQVGADNFHQLCVRQLLKTVPHLENPNCSCYIKSAELQSMKK